MSNFAIKPIFIVGPTASGKSELGFNLAKKLGGVIVSADSMQIYRGLDIGTAKESAEHRAEVKHEMIDIVPYNAEFSVAEYAERARNIIDNCLKNNIIPIIVGGTGLYIEALLFPINFAKTAKNEELRAELLAELEVLGSEHMHNKLRKLDAESADKLHINDVKRVIRALEIVISTGKTRKQNGDAPVEPMDAVVVGLTADREVLYDRINKRVDKMFECGLIDEVALLDGNFNHQSMKAIGYKEFEGYPIEFVNGAFCLSEENLTAVKDKIKQNTRNYAKRQLTWFRKYKFINWFDTANALEAEKFILNKFNVKI